MGVAMSTTKAWEGKGEASVWRGPIPPGAASPLQGSFKAGMACSLVSMVQVQ